jgi:DNA-binding response OmpR family regulator
MDPMPRLILVIEDDAPVLEALAHTVGRLGYDATLAETAADAVTLAELARPDAILLDVAVPDVNGTPAFDRLRTLRPDVPIIMVAGAGAEPLARESLRRGAFDYVMKPFNESHLTEVLRAALRRPGV